MTTQFNPKITHKIAGMYVDPMYMLPADNWDENALPYGWVGELTYPNSIGFENHFQMYRDMVAWLEEHVHNHRGNCKWVKLGDCIYVQFRKEKDMFWFKLRFGV